MRFSVLILFAAVGGLFGCDAEPPIQPGKSVLTVAHYPKLNRHFRTAAAEKCPDRFDLPAGELSAKLAVKLRGGGFESGFDLVIRCEVIGVGSRISQTEDETWISTVTLRIRFADAARTDLGAILVKTSLRQSGAGGVWNEDDLDDAAGGIAGFAVENFR